MTVRRETTLLLDQDGWLPEHEGCRHAPSPNHDMRPPGTEAYLLVIHNISLPPGEFGGEDIIALFQNRLDTDSHPWFAQLAGLRVSAHFLIRRDGTIVQFVSTDRRAWHAGVSRFNGATACNDFSIGIELEGTDDLPYENAQYDSLRRLTAALRKRHPLRAVRGHEHIAPGRKTDPGPAFDWTRMGREGNWSQDQLPRP